VSAQGQGWRWAGQNLEQEEVPPVAIASLVAVAGQGEEMPSEGVQRLVVIESLEGVFSWEEGQRLVVAVG